MARPNSPFKEAEVALVRPELEQAAAAKRALTKADVLALVEERAASVPSTRLTPDARPVGDRYGARTERLETRDVDPASFEGFDDDREAYWLENIADEWFLDQSEEDIRAAAETRADAVGESAPRCTCATRTAPEGTMTTGRSNWPTSKTTSSWTRRQCPRRGFWPKGATGSTRAARASHASGTFIGSQVRLPPNS